MANTSIVNGIRPVYNEDGSPWAGTLREYSVPASDATALYVGDPVIIAGDADATGIATATRASVGGRITGTIVGFRPSATFVANGYRAASTAEYAIVATGTGVIYEVQANGTLNAADVGLNADIVIAAGNKLTGSGVQLDVATKGTGATLALRILGFVQRADNDLTANSKVLVRINLPTEAGIASGTGI